MTIILHNWKDDKYMKCKECTNYKLLEGYEYDYGFCPIAFSRQTNPIWNETTKEYDCDKFDQKEDNKQ